MAISTLISTLNPGTNTLCNQILSQDGQLVRLPQAEQGELVEAVRAAKPEVLILDISGCDAEELVFHIGLLTSTQPATCILLLTEDENSGLLLDALSAGAKGYLDITQLEQFLTKAVHKVHSGEAWVPRKMVSNILGRLVELTSQEQPKLAAVK